MASIVQVGSSWRCQIRIKGQSVSRNFRDKETAALWAWYKESTSENIEAFDPPIQSMISLHDAMDLKMESFGEFNSKRNSSFGTMKDLFRAYLDMPVCDLTSDMILKTCEDFMGSTIKVGGVQKSDMGGRLKAPAPKTMLGRLSLLSSVYSHLQANGIIIDNPVSPILLAFRKQYFK